MKRSKSIKYLALTFLGVLVFQKSFSQENYMEGYLIRLQGDTIHGLVDYRNWKENPNKISFKDPVRGSEIIYSPLDIIGFGVADELYEGAIIRREISPSQSGKLQQDPAIQTLVDTTFLQTMVKGEKSLYFYEKAGKENFYIKQNGAFDLLEYKKYLKKLNGGKFIAEVNIYRHQLLNYLEDCSLIQPTIENTGYNKKSLEKLFLTYYKCMPGEIQFQKKVDKAPIEAGFVAGTSLTRLDFTSSTQFDYLAQGGYPLSAGVSAGLFFDLTLARNRNKWSIYNDLLLTSFKIEGKYRDFQNENVYTTTYTEIGYWYLKLNTMVRYKYPIKNFFLYLNAGVSNGIAIGKKNYKRKESIFYDTERIEEGKAMDETRKYEQGYIVGLGVKLKKYSFETRYENGNGMSTYQSLGSSTKRYHLLLGYKF